MKPIFHIIIGVVISLLLWLHPEINYLAVLVIFLSSVLIDFDHYLYFILKKKDISLIKAYNWFLKKRDFLISKPTKEQKKYKSSILIFHNFEFLIILLLLILIHEIFLWILFGIIIHLILDFIETFKRGFKNTKMSLIFNLIKNKNKKEFNF